MNKELVMMVGPPGSGKSTMAKEQFEANGYVRISQDDQGRDGHMDMFEDAIKNGLDVVVDRMNFNKEQRSRYLSQAKALGYVTRIIVRHESHDVCYERITARVGHPTIQDEESARGALKTFFTKYERVSDDEADVVMRLYGGPDHKPKAVVCDLDGTLCNINHRLHFLKNGKKDWAGFFSEINNDTINKWCSDVIRGLAKMDYKIVFASGRSDDYKKATSKWLEKHAFFSNPLHMRHRADFRHDYIVKEIILDFEILTRYKPALFIDDRQQVVDMWRKRGYVCLQCEKGDF